MKIRKCIRNLRAGDIIVSHTGVAYFRVETNLQARAQGYRVVDGVLLVLGYAPFHGGFGADTVMVEVPDDSDNS